MNGGLKVLYRVVLLEIFRSRYNLKLDTIQLVMTFVSIPWDYKVIYGVICDSVKIKCVRSFKMAPRRGYLLIFSAIQACCLLLSGIFHFQNYHVLMWLFFTCSLCGAFMDTVIDGICCVQQRRDPKLGAQDL